jgi:hypothetical protein
MKRRMDKQAGQSSSSAAAAGVNAVVDGDFFVTKAATYPIFQGLGLTPVAAGIASVLISLIPYEIVKFASRRRQLLEEEDLQLELLLRQQKRQREKGQPLGSLTQMVAARQSKRGGPSSPERGIATTTTAGSAELMSLVPVLQQKESFFVETFCRYHQMARVYCLEQAIWWRVGVVSSRGRCSFWHAVCRELSNVY